MSLVTNAYTSVEAVQRETGNDDTDVTAWFETTIVAASRWIDDWCNRDFLPKDYSSTPYEVKLDEISGNSIYLDWPIKTLTLIESGDLEVPEEAYDFNVGHRYIRLIDESVWLGKDKRRRNGLGYGLGYTVSRVGYSIPIKLTGTFGYDTPPYAVQIACTRIAAAWSHEKRRERVTYDGTRTSILDENIPDESKMLLTRFRKLVH